MANVSLFVSRFSFYFWETDNGRAHTSVCFLPECPQCEDWARFEAKGSTCIQVSQCVWQGLQISEPRVCLSRDLDLEAELDLNQAC